MTILTQDIDSWVETHFEVVQMITYILHTPDVRQNYPKVTEVLDTRGTGGLYELATDLTNEFETLHENRVWDGDYFDELDTFFKTRL